MVSIPGELRIIIDPGGALDLLAALSWGWSPYAADHAIHRFRDLLAACETRGLSRGLAILGLSPGRYANFPVGDQFGLAFYRRRGHALIDRLVHARSRGTWAGSPPYRLSPVINEVAPSSREEAATVIAGFLHDLYGNLAGGQAASHWVEDTPFNILHAEGLGELFATMKLIHVHRNPMDTLASYRIADWGGDDYETIALRLSNIYARWFEIRERLPAGLYREVGLEALSADPKGGLDELYDFIGVEAERDPPAHLSPAETHAGRWEREIPQDKAEPCLDHLRPAMTAYGYL